MVDARWVQDARSNGGMDLTGTDERGPTDQSVGDANDGPAIPLAQRLRALLQRPLPPEEIDENTRIVSAAVMERDRLDASLLIVAVCGEWFAVDLSIALRVVSHAPIHRVPHRTDRRFLGLASVQAELLPVVSLERVLGLERRQGTSKGDQNGPSGDDAASISARRMVVVGDALGAWVMPVDCVEGIRRFDSSTFIAPPATVGHASDGVTDALVPIGDGRLAARLDSTRLCAAFARSLA
jgi:chemotaxis-related protein WspD